VIAVTGAAGPVGRALIRSLLARSTDPNAGPCPDQVIAIDTQERIDRLIASLAAAYAPPEPAAQAPAADALIDPAALTDPAESAGPTQSPSAMKAVGPTEAAGATDSAGPADAAGSTAQAELSELSESSERPGSVAATHPPAPSERRRSYLPTGLASSLVSARREPREPRGRQSRENDARDGSPAEVRLPVDPGRSGGATGSQDGVGAGPVPGEKPTAGRSTGDRDRPEGSTALLAEFGLAPAADGVVTWRPAEIWAPDVVEALDRADVVVHLAAVDELGQRPGESPADRRLRAVRAAQAVSMAAAAVGARRLIAVTSAMVLGARPDNPAALDDDAHCRADPGDGTVGDLLEVERVLERIPRVHPGLSFTLIRPAALVGPGVDTSVTRHFEASRLLVLRGSGTRWQFCHVDDLAAAIWTALIEEVDGPLTAGSPGCLEESEVESISGMRRLEVPAGLAFSTAEQLNRVGVLNTPAAELAYVVHPWVVGSGRLLAAGWRPVHDNQECLQVLLEDQRRRRAAPGRRPDRRDAAAMGAAGVAVALLGTAAIVRQARSRQSRRRRSTLDP